MLPPIPSNLVLVSAQQDVVRPRPDIQPVAPIEQSAEESAIAFDKRHPQEVADRLREEQKRRQRRGHTPEEQAEEVLVEGSEELPRQGLWVDIEV
ncbi:aspartate-semialdehyde dehydrogenase [Pseudomonas sp. RIT-PI-AD]|uniref:aspartate-semialdehyde dehydrogenase n=1 Tax=Pseudomonas sp. RIT-PI-AD TaxID=3035294 RepID=UPI0021DA8A09|nr:aspartate-semialdehyde dehydrogenase [Pseudomonas sp. RIT-PI-AD]